MLSNNSRLANSRCSRAVLWKARIAYGNLCNFRSGASALTRLIVRHDRTRVYSNCKTPRLTSTLGFKMSRWLPSGVILILKKKTFDVDDKQSDLLYQWPKYYEKRLHYGYAIPELFAVKNSIFVYRLEKLMPADIAVLFVPRCAKTRSYIRRLLTLVWRSLEIAFFFFLRSGKRVYERG